MRFLQRSEYATKDGGGTEAVEGVSGEAGF
jgi:hypothetical protein